MTIKVLNSRFIAIIIVVAFCILLPFSFVEAATPRGVVCGYCDRGSLVTETRVEDTWLTGACKHGYGGYNDYLIYTYRRVYEKCNNCGRGTCIQQSLINTQFICGAAI